MSTSLSCSFCFDLQAFGGTPDLKAERYASVRKNARNNLTVLEDAAKEVRLLGLLGMVHAWIDWHS